MRLWLLLPFISLAYGQVPAPIEWPAVRPVLITGGLTNPVAIANAADGSGRLFVVEQAGRVRIVRGGKLLPQPFLEVTGRVNCCGERGLLGLAFPPGFAEKQRFYIFYTAANGNLIVSRFQVSPEDPDLADASSETVILDIDHQDYENHNGGGLAFGPKDGYLYISTGDGGGGGDSLLSSQNRASLLGKLLRIDVESGESPYGIPKTNPFVDKDGMRPEIWAYGLRNPWRFSFDRATGDLYTGDVGQDTWEELNFQQASSPGGENYGWNRMEGNHCYLPECSNEGLTLPIAEHTRDEGCSVTGGYVYRGTEFPGMQGFYFYGDYCTGRAWTLRFDGESWQKSAPYHLRVGMSSFGEDEAGNLYIADHGEGRIYELVPE